MSNSELQNAYDIVITAEKNFLTELENISTEFNNKLTALKATLPEQANSSAAKLYFARVEQNFSNVFTYDLNSVKASYGLTSANPGTPS